jgi:hypothetical protein
MDGVDTSNDQKNSYYWMVMGSSSPHLNDEN